MAGEIPSGAGETTKALIIYGGARGTTQKIARAIAEGLNDQGAQASAISVELLGMMPDRAEKVDLLGVGSPVYFLREASYITEMLAGLPSLAGRCAFAFCTTGMDRVGETLHRMRDRLKEKGARVVGAEPFRTAMSYQPYRKRGFGNPDSLPDEGELQAARGFGARMARAPHLEPVALEPVSTATRWKAGLLASRRFRKSLFPGVELKRSLCTGYGSCLSRCPFRGLDRRDGEDIPYYTDTCVQCLECVAWCPRAAIVSDSATKEWIATLSYRLGIH